MTANGKAARNRTNAQKSTGPKTVAGKAAVAQNARRHGVTAKPDPASVAVWVRVILNDPDLTPADLLAEDYRMRRALSLAAAEVKVCKAMAACDGNQHRLLRRYLREAQAQRRRSFQAWLACLEETQEIQEVA